MPEEDEYHKSGTCGSYKTQQTLKRDRAYFESQPRLSDGYNKQAEQLRSCEFKRLGSRVYVDHAGATLYSEKQLEHAYKVPCHLQFSRTSSFTSALSGPCACNDMWSA